MSYSNPSQEESSNNKKRNLPSWMTSNETKSSSGGRKSKAPDSNSTNFPKLMDGVVFVLSGFINPERAALRSQALELGADYRPDWTPNETTLLVCAYSNTPKFRQVEADNGTIVKKEWILECYSQKKLVEIDPYLMHAGKPWRKNITTTQSNSDQKRAPHIKSEKQVERGSHSKPTAPSSSKAKASNPAKGHFSLSQVKEWATDDLNRTITWLESQEEKPEPTEIKQIAAGGIIICLQDAVDSLEQDQDVRKIAEQWNTVPHAVEELIKIADAGKSAASLSKEDLCKQAKAFKQIYEAELSNVNDDSKLKTKRLKNDENDSGGNTRSNAADYDSDETVEMTEEEIDLAYDNLASKLYK